jgi:hypothetical protein
VALHTGLKPGTEQDYERAHREVPAELLAANSARTQQSATCSGLTASATRRDGSDDHVSEAVDLVGVRGPAVEHHLIGAEVRTSVCTRIREVAPAMAANVTGGSGFA